MKQLMIAILLSCLVFGLTAAAVAETSKKTPTETSTKTSADTSKKTPAQTTVYLDALLGNYHETEDMQTPSVKFDGNLSGVILGLESPVNNRFKFGLEYGQGSVNDINSKSSGSWSNYTLKNYDLTLFEAKGGYRVVDHDLFKLDVIISVLNIDYKTKYIFNSSGNTLTQQSNIGGNMLGADLVCNFSDKASLQCTLASSLLGAYVANFQNRDAVDEAAINEYKIKFNYFVAERWALTLGYRYYQFSGKTIYPTSVDKMDGNLSGATIGVKYQF
jgi:opacity protein-like surface antigen